jgi:hypothetical protein
MNSPRICFAAFVTLAFASASFAQLMVFSGHVTAVTGTYAGTFTLGDAVVFTADFAPAQLLPSENAPGPGIAFNRVTGALTIGGAPVSLAPGAPNLRVALFDVPGFEGVSIDQQWGAPADRHFFSQALLGPGDLLPDLAHFPAGIPISQFTRTRGSLVSFDPLPTDNIIQGQVEWVITAYTGFGQIPAPPPFPTYPAVPEPATFGLLGALLLGLGVARARLTARAG